MNFCCDVCTNRFSSDEDVEGEKCNRCDEGNIVYDDDTYAFDDQDDVEDDFDEDYSLYVGSDGEHDPEER